MRIENNRAKKKVKRAETLIIKEINRALIVRKT